MADFLETRFGKFIFRVKSGYLYSSDGIWVDIRGNVAILGLSDFLQKSNGDVTFLVAVKPGKPAKTGQELGRIETIKAIFEIISPVTGKVIKINSELENSPNLINDDPYGAGWIYEIELADSEDDRRNLLNAESYLKLMEGKLEKEAHKRNGK